MIGTGAVKTGHDDDTPKRSSLTCACTPWRLDKPPDRVGVCGGLGYGSTEPAVGPLSGRVTPLSQSHTMRFRITNKAPIP